MRASIKRWGNSAALRLPASVLQQANFSSEQEVEFQVVKGRITIVPASVDEFDLEYLLEGLSTETHAKADFGKPAGKEAF